MPWLVQLRILFNQCERLLARLFQHAAVTKSRPEPAERSQQLSIRYKVRDGVCQTENRIQRSGESEFRIRERSLNGGDV